MSLYDWSETAGDNATADSEINWAEGQDPDTVNNSSRAMMRRIAQLIADLTPTKRTATGSGGAYVVSSASAPSTLVDGFQIGFMPNHDNPGAATLKVDTFGAKPLRGKAGTALDGGEVLTSVPTVATYNSANDEFLLGSSGYHVVNTGASIAGLYNSGLRVGDVVINLDTSPKEGRIRLGESTQSVLKADYPELDSWASDEGYPWGSDATNFTLPAAAGYFLRFAGTTTANDPDGPRTAGSTQAEATKTHSHGVGSITIDTDSHTHAVGTLAVDSGGAHTHAFSGTTATDGAHTHSYTKPVSGAAPGGTGVSDPISTTGDQTGSSGNHTHAFSGTTDSDGAHTHSLSGATASYDHTHVLGGTTDATTGDETRPINIAMHADIIASPAQANVSIYATNGFSYVWDNGTSGDPGSGALLFDNADPASATAVHISETDNFGSDLSGVLDVWDDGNSSPLGQLYIYKVGAPATFAIFDVASVTDSGAYRTLAVTPLADNGTFADQDQIGVQWQRVGDKGATGSGGGGGLSYQGTWNASTNTPTLSDGSGTGGDYYIVSDAGSTSIDGESDWGVGDWIIANSTTWQKIDNSDIVTSVAGKTGAVSLVIADIASLQTSLDAKAALAGATFAGDIQVPNLTATGSITVTGTVDGRDVATDGSKLDGIASSANNYSHPNHTGDVTSVADGATTIAANAVTTAKIADANVTTGKIADDAVTLAKMEHGTEGDVLYYGASGVPARLAKGTADQVLTMNTGATAPEWKASGGATVGLVPLDSGTIASAVSSVDIDLSSYTDYGALKLVLNGIQVATDNVNVLLRVSVDGGSTFKSTAGDYRKVQHAAWDGAGGGSLGDSLGSSETAVTVAGTVGNDSTAAANATIELFAWNDTALWTYLLTNASSFDAAGGVKWHAGAVAFDTADNITDLRLLASSGNLDGGTWALYGYKNT